MAIGGPPVKQPWLPAEIENYRIEKFYLILFSLMTWPGGGIRRYFRRESGITSKGIISNVQCIRIRTMHEHDFRRNSPKWIFTLF